MGRPAAERVAPPELVALPDGRVACPSCPAGKTYNPGSGFVMHLTAAHQHVRVDQAIRDVLWGLGKARCNKAACGAVRAVGTTRCVRCRETRGIRRFEIGDITPGAQGTAIPTEPEDLQAAAERAAEGTTAGPEDAGRP